MNKLAIIGTALILLAAIGFAVPYFETNETSNIATVGDVKLQTTETVPHVIPRVVASGVLVIGIVLLGAGVLRRA